MQTPNGNRVTFHPLPVKPTPLFYDTIPAALAQLCLDCSTVWDLRATTCPACGSRAGLPILKILDRQETVNQ